MSDPSNSPNSETTQPPNEGSTTAPATTEEVKAEPVKKTFVSITDVEYEKRYQLIKREIDNELDPSQHLDALEEVLLTFSQPTTSPISREHQAYFLHDALPAIVRLLTHRRFRESDDLYLRTNDFFLKVLDFITVFMPWDLYGLLESLVRIFDGERNFYGYRMWEKEDLMYARYQSEKAQQEGSFELKDYAVMSNTSRAPRFLVHNINYFVNRRGLDAMIARLQTPEPRMSIPTLKLHITAWNKIRLYLIPDLQNHYFPHLEVVLNILRDISEEELKQLRKEDVEEIIKSLDALLRPVQGPEASEKTETFFLNFALKCFKCANLEKRMHGLSYIEEAIQMVARKKNSHYGWDHSYESSTSAHMRSYSTAKWLEPAHIIEFIQQNQILPSVFQAKLGDMHPELVRRSKVILKFLADNRVLSQDNINMLWKATQTQHTEAAVFEVLGAMCLHLDLEHQLYLLKVIQEVPFMNYTPRMITLLAQFHSQTYSATSHTEVKLKVLNVLWQLIQDDSVVEQSIVDLALNQMGKLVTQYHMRPHRLPLMKNWIDRIRKRQSVQQCITLIQKVLAETFYDEVEYRHLKDSENSRQKVLNDFKKSCRLVDLLFRELAEYKQEVRLKLQELEKEGQVIDKNNYVFVGRYPHLQAIQARLDFIKFTLDFSSARLTSIRADLLWETLIMGAITPEEAEKMLTWFFRICMRFDKVDSNPVSSKMAHHLFSERLCHLDFGNISTTAFDCFKRYFCCVNAMQRSLRMDTPHDEHYFVQNFAELSGIDSLWLIVLTAKNEVVFSDSMHFLVNLHQRIGNKRHPQQQTPVMGINDIRKFFIDTCMGHLMQYMQAVRKGEGDAIACSCLIDRLITLLQTFLEEGKRRDEAAERDNNQALIGPLPLEASRTSSTHSREQAGPPKARSPYDRQNVEFLMSMMGLPELEVTIALQKNNWHLDNTTVWLFEDANKQSVINEAAKWSNPAPAEAEEPKKVEPPPKDIPSSRFLSDNQAYFDQLFELLTFNYIKSEKVWEILTSLPVNPIIENTLSTLQGDGPDDTPRWDDLLNARSIYKTLYCLQIIDSLMGPPEGSKDTISTKQSIWCRTFFHRGGFHHLLEMLSEGKIREQAHSPAYKTCLRLLLKIIYYFLRVGLGSVTSKEIRKGKRMLSLSSETNRDLLDDIRFPEFLKVLIQLISDLSAGPIKYRVDPANPEADIAIIQDAVSLIVAAVGAKPGLLSNFYDYAYDENNDKNAKMKEREGASSSSSSGDKVLGGIGGGIYERERGRIEEFIVNMVMNHPVRKIRKCVTHGFLLLCDIFSDTPEILQGAVSPHSFFLELLLAHMPPEGATNLRCEQYFKFLNTLISYFFVRSNVDEAFRRFEGIFSSAVARIKRRPVIEESANGPPDLVLVGELSIVCTIAAKYPSIKRKLASPDGDDMINELWHKCLFSEPSNLIRRAKLKWRENNKCKTKKSRAMCFKLLTELARDCQENLITVLQLLLPNHQTETEASPTWDVPAGKNDCGFVGLYNPGCICYMNALMQQLYMTPALRYGLMTVQPSSKVDPQENVLIQLQNMFGYLMHSEKQFYDPSETFCKAFKDRGGKPMDLHAQQDAEEFLRLLCERLEELLKGTGNEKLLNNFTGVASQILRCPNDLSHYSEREDPVSVISIEIKGKANLTEALSFYVQGEQVEWKCDKCEKTVDALKRTSLKKLPNTLMLHLQRFEFNYDTMLRVKLSNHFEFPKELDMEPYTTEGVARREALAELEAKKKEALARAGDGADKLSEEEWMSELNIELPELAHPRSYYEYELVGVLVHSGTAEVGHYYSYIKDRTKPNHQWFIFDDKTVKPWNIRDLEEECFGGEQTTTHYNSNWTTKTPRLKNAYMLFYQRKLPEPEEFALPEIVQRPMLAENKEERKRLLSLHHNEKGKEKETVEGTQQLIKLDTGEISDDEDLFRTVFTEVVPDVVLEEVWQQNHSVTRQRYLFEPPYLAFMRDVLSLVRLDKPVLEIQGPLEEDFTFRVVKLATYFAMETLAKVKDQDALYRSFVDIMFTIYSTHLPAARWFLTCLMDPHKKWLRYHLLEANEASVRQGFANVVLAGLTLIAHTEHDIMANERAQRLPEIKERNDPDIPLPTAEGQTVQEYEWTYASQSMAIQFVEHLLSMSESTRPLWKKFHWYWWLLKKFAMIGHEERMFLVERGMIGILIDYYMGDFSPYKKLSGRAKIGDKSSDLNLMEFMYLLAISVGAAETKGIKATGTRPPTCHPDDVELAWPPLRCMHLLSHKEAFASLLKQCYNEKCNKALVQHLSWEDEERTYWILQILLANVKSNDSSLKGSVLYVLDSLFDMLEIKDSLQQWRVTIAIGNQKHGLIEILDRTKQSEIQLIPICNFLHRCLLNNPVVTAYLFKVKDDWAWLEKYLQEPDPLYRVSTYNIDSPLDDVKEVYAKLKPFWDLNRWNDYINRKAQGETGGGDAIITEKEEKEKEKEEGIVGKEEEEEGKGKEKEKEKEKEDEKKDLPPPTDPMIVYATEWNEELDNLPRTVMQVFFS